MIITGITAQQKDKNRVNVMVDGVYRFSLDILQVGDLGIKVGKEYTEEELQALEVESSFGKVYTRALEYCLMRPHSAREVRDYLYRKTRTTKVRRRSTGELVERPGVASEVTTRVYERLVERGYINDESFARYWIENRSQTKGISHRKLQLELRGKGVESGIIDRLLRSSIGALIAVSVLGLLGVIVYWTGFRLPPRSRVIRSSWTGWKKRVVSWPMVMLRQQR